MIITSFSSVAIVSKSFNQDSRNEMQVHLKLSFKIDKKMSSNYLYGFGFGISFWSSQTGAGSRNGGCGGGIGVVVAGRIGPVFVL